MRNRAGESRPCHSSHTVSYPSLNRTFPEPLLLPDEMNRYIRTVIVPSMTTAGKDYPTSKQCEFQGKKGRIVLDQIRKIDKSRLIKIMGIVGPHVQTEVISTLDAVFCVIRSTYERMNQTGITCVFFRNRRSCLRSRGRLY